MENKIRGQADYLMSPTLGSVMQILSAEAVVSLKTFE